MQRHLPLRETLSTATIGPRARPLRALLSALGVAIGIASLMALIGIPASQRAQTVAEFDALGANLLVAYPAPDPVTGEPIPIPVTVVDMVNRIGPVKGVFSVYSLLDTAVYRSDKIPPQQTGDVSAVAIQGDMFAALGVHLHVGEWFDQGLTGLPTVVLGATAALHLNAQPGHRLWIHSRWFAVIGILDPMPLASQLNLSAFLAPTFAVEMIPDAEISAVYVACDPGKAADVRGILAATINPHSPRGVSVTQPSELNSGQEIVFDAFMRLSLGLGSVALFVGGVGIVNTMVVAVMERRNEIGLRRSLGARTGQIALQFLLESSLVGLTGGVTGVIIGTCVVLTYTWLGHITFVIPWFTIVLGPVLAAAIGAIAGLYPAIKASRQPPTLMLRAL